MTVTVLIAAYNRQQFVRRAVESVLRSTVPRTAYEVVVVKNFLQPELDAFLQAQDVRVLNEGAEPIGTWMAKGFAIARGRIICLLNDDDEFEPEKLARVTELFQADPTLTFVHDRRTLIDPTGASVPVRRRWGFVPRGPVRLATEHDRTARLADCYAARALFYDSCMSFSKAIVADRLDLIRQVEIGEDAIVFFCAMAHPGALLLDDRVLTRFRVHGESMYRTDKATVVERFDRRRVVALVEQIAQGTPAEPAARLYALGQTFNRFLADARQPSPSAGMYGALVRAVVTYRVRAQVVVLVLAILKRLAPKAVSRLYAHLRDQMDDRVA